MALSLLDHGSTVEVSFPGVWAFRRRDRWLTRSQLARPSEVISCRLNVVTPTRGTALKVSLTLPNNDIVSVRKDRSVPPSVTLGLKANGLDVKNGRLVFSGPVSWTNHPDIVASLSSQADSANQSWVGAFSFKQELRDGGGNLLTSGLRSPQIGALHAIAAHWTVSSVSALVVMPTGTGKTEVMLAAMAMHRPQRLLVLVPSDSLRHQAYQKFCNLGILQQLGVLSGGALRPVVGMVRAAPRSDAEIQMVRECNVVVSTVAALQGLELSRLRDLIGLFDAVFFDEAHHIPANSWQRIADTLTTTQLCLQFTATPFRMDGRRIPGRIIYEFPLRMAQAQGYFRKINFVDVYEPDLEDGDAEIAERAVEQLRTDLAAGRAHFMIARADSTTRAEELFNRIYEHSYVDLNPVVIHSHSPRRQERLAAIRAGQHKIIVCVDMFGEGFDFPGLKIAALHDVHKSLAVTLQFTGRFTRDAPGLGEATVVANTADPRVTEAIEDLYAEDSDWNELIPELSAKAIQSQVSFSDFAQRMERREGSEDDLFNLNVLRPKTSTVIYRTRSFTVAKARAALRRTGEITASWFSRDRDLAVFVTRSRVPIEWATIKETSDEIWDLFVIAHDAERGLLFINSSKKKTLYQDLAKSVGGAQTQLVSGEAMFRVFYGISRLVFHTAGLYRRGAKLRFHMFAGLDVVDAISPVVQTNSTKSNMFAAGYENGKRVTAGASHKGRLWAMSSSSIPDWKEWCARAATKILDTSIPTDGYLSNTLIPQEIHELPPNKELFSALFSATWYTGEMEAARLFRDDVECDFHSLGLEGSRKISNSRVELTLAFQGVANSIYALNWGPSDGQFLVGHVSGPQYFVSQGSTRRPLHEVFQDNPPALLFLDGSELIGPHLMELNREGTFAFNPQSITAENWTGVDIRKESKWRNQERRDDSIQARLIEALVGRQNTFVFDDDDTGELADVIEVTEREGEVLFRLYHCKYSRGTTPGERVADLYEVCGQAVRSARWVQNPRLVVRHLQTRNAPTWRNGRPTRFEKGEPRAFLSLKRRLPRLRTRFEIAIVQPGLSKSQLGAELSSVIGAANSYILEITGNSLSVIASP